MPGFANPPSQYSSKYIINHFSFLLPLSPHPFSISPFPFSFPYFFHFTKSFLLFPFYFSLFTFSLSPFPFYFFPFSFPNFLLFPFFYYISETNTFIMKRIKWFQHFMITLLIGLNSFVFMSMRDISIGNSLLYSFGFIIVSISILSLLGYLRRPRKKKSQADSL